MESRHQFVRILVFQLWWWSGQAVRSPKLVHTFFRHYDFNTFLALTTLFALIFEGHVVGKVAEKEDL